MLFQWLGRCIYTFLPGKKNEWAVLIPPSIILQTLCYLWICTHLQSLFPQFTAAHSLPALTPQGVTIPEDEDIVYCKSGRLYFPLGNCLSSKNFKSILNTRQLILTPSETDWQVLLLLVLSTRKICSEIAFHLNFKISTYFTNSFSNS